MRKNPCNDSLSKWDTDEQEEECPSIGSPGTCEPKNKWDTSDLDSECPNKEPSVDAGSEEVETLGRTPRARGNKKNWKMPPEITGT